MKRLRVSDVLLLAVGAAYWPLNIMASNLIGIVHPERLLGLAALILLVSLLIALVLIVAGVPRFSAVGASFLVTVLSVSGGALNREVGTALGFVSILILGVGAIWLVVRHEGDILMTAAIWAIAVALIAQPLVSLFQSFQNVGVSAVVRPEPLDIQLINRPDIFLILLDGYPGSIAMNQDNVPPGIVDIREDLMSLEFELPASAWSPYWTTSLATPSILDMGYPVTQEWDGNATSRDLFEIISGLSRFHEVLGANGYQTYHVESGWTGSSCGIEAHVCVPSPFMDEAMFLALRNSVAAAAFGNFGGPFVNGALAAMDWLRSQGPRLSESEIPNFVFAHVVAPHRPFVLESDCSIADSETQPGAISEGRDETSGFEIEELVDQTDCVDRFMVDFARSIDPEDVVIFVSDHGTDRRDQTNEYLVDWSEETIVERLNVFVAARLPEGCSIGEELVTSNLMLRTLSCLSDTSPVPNQRRMWINPMEELAPEVVDDLMAMRPAD